MMRLKTLFLLVCASMLVAFDGGAAAAQGPPNVVLIVADDLGYGEVECYPNVEARPLPTPHIDALARSGVRCTQGYSADPMCWPSRASILTGRYHQRFRRTNPLPETERAIGQFLKRRGYATGCFGKWHNTGSIGAWDLRPVNHPAGWGFDDFAGFLGGMHDYFDAKAGTHFLLGKNREYYMPVYRGTRPVDEIGYMTDWITERAVEFVGRHGRRSWPYFLYLAYTAIHSPDQATDEYLERNRGDVRRAMLDAMDSGIGRVLEAVADADERRSTLVLLVGDNGGYRETSNWKLRGEKGGLFEGGIRVPFILSWPGQLPEGETYDRPVMHIDLVPTVLAAVGGQSPKNLDGVDLIPFLKSERSDPPHELLFWGRGDRFAVRRGPWKLVQDRERRGLPPKLHLFHLEDDVAERHNLADEHAPLVQELLEARRQWRKGLR